MHEILSFEVFFCPPFFEQRKLGALAATVQCNRGSRINNVRENEGDDDARVGVCRMANSKEGESWSEDFLVGDSNPLLPHTDGCVYLLRLHDGRHLPPQRDAQHPGDGEAVLERLKRNASTAHYLDAAHAARIDLNRAAVGGEGLSRGRESFGDDGGRRSVVVAAAAPCAPTRTGSIGIIVTADRTQYAATCGSTSRCGRRTDWRRSKGGRGRCLSPSTRRYKGRRRRPHNSS